MVLQAGGSAAKGLHSNKLIKHLCPRRDRPAPPTHTRRPDLLSQFWRHSSTPPCTPTAESKPCCSAPRPHSGHPAATPSPQP